MVKRRRRQFRETEVIVTLLLQGAVITCYRCKVAFTVEDLTGQNVQKEHLDEHGAGGPDEPQNCVFSHCECHKRITFGTGATTAGSSVNRIAKARPDRVEKFVVRKRPLDADRVSEPVTRCRTCGGFPGECICPAREKRSAFGGRR